MVCNCCASCCCVGDSAIGYDEDLNPTGNECQDIESIVPDEECDGDPTAAPAEEKECEDVAVVVEWCGLTVNGTSGSVQEQAPNFPAPPPLCSAGGVDVYRRLLYVTPASSNAVNPAFASYSDCQFGCEKSCGLLLLRFAVFVDETPDVGAARSRLYYVTYREGCDDSPIIETVFDQGAYCCPDLPEITITLAP